MIAGAVAFGLIAAAVFQGVNYTIEKFLPEKNTSQNSGIREKIQVVETYISAPSDSSSLQSDITTIVENTMPAMVSIDVISTQIVSGSSIFPGLTQNYEKKVQGAGSGIIIGKSDTELYILTNYHVIEGAESISVTFCNNTSSHATVKGYDETEDLAVLTIVYSDLTEGTIDEIAVAILGSSENLKLGSKAIAIGNALGYGQTVTVGYISALNRNVTDSDGTTRTLIQTDAAINPGNSGGALLNEQGEVIGINTMKYTSDDVDNVGFSIPISTARTVFREILERVVYTGEDVAYLGISGANVSDIYSRYEQFGIPAGIYVDSVTENLPAANAGIRAGDIITAFDGKKIESMTALQRYLTYKTSGDTAEITIQRKKNNGSYEAITLTVALISRKDAGIES